MVLGIPAGIYRRLDEDLGLRPLGAAALRSGDRLVQHLSAVDCCACLVASQLPARPRVHHCNRPQPYGREPGARPLALAHLRPVAALRRRDDYIAAADAGDRHVHGTFRPLRSGNHLDNAPLERHLCRSGIFTLGEKHDCAGTRRGAGRHADLRADQLSDCSHRAARPRVLSTCSPGCLGHCRES